MSTKVESVTIEYSDGSKAIMEFSGVHEPLEQSGTTYEAGETGWNDIPQDEYMARSALEESISDAVTRLDLWPEDAS